MMILRAFIIIILKNGSLRVRLSQSLQASHGGPCNVSFPKRFAAASLLYLLNSPLQPEIVPGSHIASEQ